MKLDQAHAPRRAWPVSNATLSGKKTTKSHPPRPANDFDLASGIQESGRFVLNPQTTLPRLSRASRHQTTATSLSRVSVQEVRPPTKMPAPQRLINCFGNMFGTSRNRDKGRYYLLPGMGGRAHRRKHKKMLIIALIVGALAAGLLAWVLWLFNNKQM